MANYGDLQNITSTRSSWIWTFTSSAKDVILDTMPSIRSLLKFSASVLGTAQLALGRLSSPVHRLAGNSSAAAACPHPQLSCHNTTAVQNLCCFNAPGGTLLQTQFWDTNPASGPSDSWTIHGLWPDNCDGTYSANCDDTRAYTNISAILESAGDTTLLDYMRKYWTTTYSSAETFWQHEWGKHGTCISTLDPDCYTDYRPTEEVPDFFQTTVNLFKSLPSYDWLKSAGIEPSTTKTYTAAQIQNALKKHHGGKEVYLGCENGKLDEIWYFFNVRGSVQTGTFVPTESVGGDSTCPDTGIQYVPKSSGGGGDGTSSSSSSSPSSSSSVPSSSSSSAPSSTPTGPAFSGSGYLNVITSGSKHGCIISGGTWYTSGTCATFTASSSGDGFTLQSSKGDCVISGGELSCASSVSNPSTFSADGTKLVYNDGSTFYADAVPSGFTQGTVYTGSSGHDVTLDIEWQTV